MSTLGFYQDAPHKITTEGREITIKIQKTSPSTAIITWTLPKGAPGCSIADLAYNGIVIVVDETPIKLNQTPVELTYYTGDPTVDRNIHAGDKIGSGLVVGAFYDDKSTTYLEISGLQNNVPYYVAGFAVSNTGAYHREGVHSYSQNYQEQSTSSDKAGFQLVQLGVELNDVTGLISTNNYSFDITIDGTLHTITVAGSAGDTYNNLINALNEKFCLLSNPYQGTTPPNYGSLYVNRNTEQAFSWNGSSYVLQDAIISENVPTTPTTGSFWVNSQTGNISEWDGLNWLTKEFISFDSDPTTPLCKTYWNDGALTHQWDGNVWIPTFTFNQLADPAASQPVPCGSFWFNTTSGELFVWKSTQASCVIGDLTTGSWVQTTAFEWSDDPRDIPIGYYWFNPTNESLKILTAAGWVDVASHVEISDTAPQAQGVGSFWINVTDEELFQWNGTVWTDITGQFITWNKNPVNPESGDLWWDDIGLHVWDGLSTSWILISSFIESAVDPSAPLGVQIGNMWNNGTSIKEWDGMQWITPCLISYSINPKHLPDNAIWLDTNSGVWYKRLNGGWIQIDYISHSTPPTMVNPGQFWYNNTAEVLFVWNGMAWVPLMVSFEPITNTVGSLWYKTSEKTLYEWTGTEWSKKTCANVTLDEGGCLSFSSGTTGSGSSINLKDHTAPQGLFVSLTPAGRIQPPIQGTDSVQDTPSYNQLGVGTDGSSEERREMVENILLQLGYPTVNVELTKQQLEFCVDQGLQTLRRAGSSGYERVYFFINLKANQQHYILSDKTVGFHKIVEIMKIHRTTSAFLGTAEGQGVYGQVVLQHLYSMGNFDLVSYHIINEYIELMEKMFAADIMYSWKEKTRTLSIKQNLWRDERILVDAVIERTEQDILADRYLNNWIQLWATSEACMILAETRGKFSSLPGAGGGISLNSSDLRARADRGFEQCMKELEDFVANDVEAYGGGAAFIMG